MIMSMKDVCSKESGMVALVAEEQDLVLFPENGQGEQGKLPWPCFLNTPTQTPCPFWACAPGLQLGALYIVFC